MATAKTVSENRWTTLPNWKFQLLPRDTRTIITCVFLGLTMAVILQITERLDLALTGGSIPIVSAIVVCAIWVPSAAFYGLTGALITAWINPIISNLTASQPMAPFLFLTNAAHTIPVALLVWVMKSRDKGLKLWQLILIGQIGGLGDALMFGVGNRVILHLPWGFISGQVLIVQPCYLVGSLITYGIMRRLVNTGLVQKERDLKAAADAI
ncbi:MULTISPECIES: hypothetical protein [Streptomyces]|uniref:ECF transporter S component n=2 Tax=Streptomyces TaxID=1883 RepID=A0A6N9U8V4_STRHA|nr:MULTISPECIES: hypothetical protein [Streptomyces]AWL41262.1 hypothetical protein B9S64_26580 [Streptomyces sp. SM18]KDQ70244.1 hypothetical protein DT87_24550 [Streptomyces sp. NTK 937]MBV7671762.1 hypothetical protein [Streptomyces halstedii]MCW8215764.1 hypothetical protein [Streptomyces griseolus]MYR72667.1 hypothetical protein [Streptomyces sp. SID4925]